jgi:hypothetical protein
MRAALEERQMGLLERFGGNQLHAVVHSVSKLQAHPLR